MKKSFLYLLLIGIAASSIIIGTVYATLGSITSPGTNLPGANTLYAVKVNPATTSTIAHILLNFHGGFTLGGARVFHVQNIGAGHLSFPNTTAISYNVITPVSIPSGTQIDLLLGNIINPNSASSNAIAFTTQDSSNNTLETGGITLNIANVVSPDITDSGNPGPPVTQGNVGINNTSPAHVLDVGGDIGLSGNLRKDSASELKILPASGQAICIGSGC
jgi:hypothetical protein